MASKTLTLAIPAAKEAKYKAEIDEGIAEIDRILKELKQKDAQIERTRKRTRAKLDCLKAIMR